MVNVEPKIDCKIVKNKNYMSFYINYMDERFRNISTDNSIFNTYHASNGVQINSKNHPAVIYNPNGLAVNLLGNEPTEDGRIVVIRCQTSSECVTLINRIVAALTEWATNWEGWDNNTVVDSGNSEDITIDINV